MKRKPWVVCYMSIVVIILVRVYIINFNGNTQSIEKEMTNTYGGLGIRSECVIDANLENVEITYENTQKLSKFRNNETSMGGKNDNLIQLIRKDCGQLCNTSRVGSPGKYFDEISAPVDCPAIFKNDLIDRSHGLKHPPTQIPNHLWNYYTMEGRIKVFKYYCDQQYLEGNAFVSIWPRQGVEQMINAAKRGELAGNYGKSETNALRDALRHAPGIIKGRVLVIGSENPWVEACVLEAGAKEIITLEYGKIMSEHPQITTITPLQFRRRYLNNTIGQFDAVVTFSSVEHSGLGRYGDILNPWGDIIAVARAWCVTRNEGSLTIGVMYDYNNDRIRFNADRIYGKIRYPYLVSNWKQIYRGQGFQRLHVLIKRSENKVSVQ